MKHFAMASLLSYILMSTEVPPIAEKHKKFGLWAAKNGSCLQTETRLLQCLPNCAL